MAERYVILAARDHFSRTRWRRVGSGRKRCLSNCTLMW